jgi:hypothetical protein
MVAVPVAYSVVLAVTVMLAGCSSAFDPSGKPGVVRPISGRIRVIDVEPWMSSAMVRFQGRRCMAWWDNYSAFYADGQLIHQMPDISGVSYHFDGLLTDRDIYLGQVWGGAAAPQFNGTPGRTVRYGMQQQKLPGQTIMTVTPVKGGLPLPTTKPGIYSPSGKQHKIPLPHELGN